MAITITTEITEPTSGTEVQGAVTLKVHAVSSTHIKMVDVNMDGGLWNHCTFVEGSDTDQRWEYSWDTSELANRSYVIGARTLV